MKRLSWLSPRVIDDRKRPLPFMPGEGVPPNHGDARLDAVLGAIAKATRDDPLTAAARMGFFIALFFAISMMRAGTTGWRSSAASLVVGLGFGASGIVLGMLGWRPTLRAGPIGDFKRLLLRHGYCAACSFNLHGLPAAADGCVECPECGGAWRATRLVDTRPGSSEPVPPIRVEKSGVLCIAAPLRASDARGVRGRLWPLMRRIDLRHDYAEAFARAARDIRRPMTRRWRNTMVGLAIAAAGLFLFTRHYFGPPVRFWDAAQVVTGWSALACAIAAVALSVLRMPLAEHRRRTIAAFTGWSICPRCGEDLIGERPAADGCVLCPTCDAAWRLGRPPASACGRCSYDLSATAISPSGHTTCPECGKTQLVDRDRRTDVELTTG